MAIDRQGAAMPRDKTNILDVLLFTVLTIGFAVIALFNWRGGEVIGGLVLTGLMLLCGAATVDGLQRGVRPPTSWERFKAWMVLRPVLIGGVGIVVFLQLPADLGSALPALPHDTAAGLLVIGLLVWAISIGYTLWRAPHRFEADAAYRRRIKYRD
jgi:hypothetical protein